MGKGFQEIGHVLGRVLRADGETQAAFGPLRGESQRFQRARWLGIAAFAGRAAAGGNAGHVQVHQQVVAADVAESEAGVVRQPFCRMAGEDAVVGKSGQQPVNELIPQCPVMGVARVQFGHGQFKRFGRAHGVGDVGGSGATADFRHSSD